MAIQNYAVTLIGKTPLLLHHDNIEWSDAMEAWRADPANKNVSVPGDDRSPAWRWLGCLYHDGVRVTIPADNIQSALRGGGALVPKGKGKGNATFKSQSQSGMYPVESDWPLRVRGREILMAELEELRKENSFGQHLAKARAMGFSLFVKRAKVGASKHVRVRPRFDEWQVNGTIRVIDEQITMHVLQQILEYAGRYKGLGDWRPGAPKTPGPFGLFEARVKLA